VRPKFVEIEWVDILATSGWEKPEEVDPTRCWSVGYLIFKDDKTIKIANTLGDMDGKKEWAGIHAFPIGCVKKIRPISGAHGVIDKFFPIQKRRKRTSKKLLHIVSTKEPDQTDA